LKKAERYWKEQDGMSTNTIDDMTNSVVIGVPSEPEWEEKLFDLTIIVVAEGEDIGDVHLRREVFKKVMKLEQEGVKVEEII
jgi:hypothetical protein